MPLTNDLSNLAAEANAIFNSITANATAITAISIGGTPFNANSAIPAGTVMLFVQNTAPTGWTKSTTHDNKALRIVSGNANTGGSVAFTSAFASQGVAGSLSSTTVTGSVGSTTLSLSQIPSHGHSASAWEGIFSPGGTGRLYYSRNSDLTSMPIATDFQGGGGSHNHSFTGDAHSHTFTGTAINLAVQYVDAIIASKN